MPFDKKIQFGRDQIDVNSRPYLIAEIGLNHNNDLELAKRTIEAAHQSGANAVKFQSYHTNKFIDVENEEAKALVDIFSRYELSEESHKVLKSCADDLGIAFFSTPLNVEYVELLDEMGVPGFKVASGDLNNFQLLDSLVKKNKPLIISTGASDRSSIKKTQSYLNELDFSAAMFLHCISIYPAPDESLSLATIPWLENKLDAIVGFSDHTVGCDAAPVATALGALIIEKHFTLDQGLEGPDHKLSATPVILTQLRKKIDQAFEMLGKARTNHIGDEALNEKFGKRSLYERDGGFIALRPRLSHLPKDSEYINLSKKQ